MKANILITAISSSNAISFIKGLRSQSEIKLRIAGTDISKKVFSAGAQFVDKFFEVPPASEAHYVSALLEICRKNNIDILVPIIDEEFLPISKNRKRFEAANTRVMLPAHEHLLQCHDKYKTYLFFKEHNIPTPSTSLTPPGPKGCPVLAKPRFGRGSRDISTIRNIDDLRRLEGRNHIFQKIIRGEEYTIDTLSDTEGRAIAAVPRLRLEIRNGISYRAKTVKNKRIEDTSVSICEMLKLTGPACIQCIMAPTGRPYFFEINPRIGSAVVLTIRAGINIPFLAVKNILGMRIPRLIGKFQENVVMLRYWEEIYTKDNATR